MPSPHVDYPQKARDRQRVRKGEEDMRPQMVCGGCLGGWALKSRCMIYYYGGDIFYRRRVVERFQIMFKHNDKNLIKSSEFSIQQTPPMAASFLADFLIIFHHFVFLPL